MRKLSQLERRAENGLLLTVAGSIVTHTLNSNQKELTMKQLYPNVVLTGLLTLALGLSACSNMPADTSSTASGASSSSESARSADASPPDSGSASMGNPGDPSAATGASGAAGSTATGQQPAMQQAGTPPTASTMPNSTVISIEPMASSAGSSTSGTSQASGTSSATSSDPAYRITLRMDDGSTQVVSQSSTPTYRSGDRVHLGNGVISR